MCWGVANVLCNLCFVRIGVALTGAILTGLGVSVGVTVPMIFKGSGLFKDAANIASVPGVVIMGAVCVMLGGVIFASLAGFGRDRELKKLQKTSGSFLGGLIMTVIAGITSAGISFAFVYSQDPIISRVTTVQAGQTIKLNVEGNKTLSHTYEVGSDGVIQLGDKNAPTVEIAGMSAKAAADAIAGVLNLSQVPEKDAKVHVDTQNVLAVFPVWAVGLLGGALVNIFYPAYLMTKRHNWSVLTTSNKELILSGIMGIQFFISVSLNGKGMILLGALGASIGFGIQQAMQMIGSQGLGFISGEWKGVHGKPREQMFIAIGILLVAAMILAYSNTLK
jgi:hypothetical protein